MLWDIKTARHIASLPAPAVENLIHLPELSLLIGGPGTWNSKGKTHIWDCSQKGLPKLTSVADEALYNLAAAENGYFVEGQYSIRNYTPIRPLVGEDIEFLLTRLYLDKPPVESLNFSGIKFNRKTTESLCDCIPKLPQLKVLNLTATDISEHDVEKIYRDCVARNIS